MRHKQLLSNLQTNRPTKHRPPPPPTHTHLTPTNTHRTFIPAKKYDLHWSWRDGASRTFLLFFVGKSAANIEHWERMPIVLLKAVLIRGSPHQTLPSAAINHASIAAWISRGTMVGNGRNSKKSSRHGFSLQGPTIRRRRKRPGRKWSKRRKMWWMWGRWCSPCWGLFKCLKAYRLSCCPPFWYPLYVYQISFRGPFHDELTIVR